jgi:hypothetical protein
VSVPVKSFREWNSLLYSFLLTVDIPSLITVCIVGSHRRARKLDRVHDVDILLLVRDLSPKVYQTVLSQFGILAARLSTPRVSVTVEMRLGPLKPHPPPTGAKHVQLHCLLYDLATWDRVQKYPGCKEWIDANEHIRGKPLAAVSRTEPLTIDAVVRDLEVMVTNLKQHSAYCRVYHCEDGAVQQRLSLIPADRHTFAHMVIYGANNSAKNYMKIAGADLPAVCRPILLKTASLKRSLQNGEESALNEAERLAFDIVRMIDVLLSHARNIAHAPPVEPMLIKSNTRSGRSS